MASERTTQLETAHGYQPSPRIEGFTQFQPFQQLPSRHPTEQRITSTCHGVANRTTRWKQLADKTEN